MPHRAAALAQSACTHAQGPTAACCQLRGQGKLTSSCFSVCTGAAAWPAASLARLASTEAGMWGPLVTASLGWGSATWSRLATSFTRLPCGRQQQAWPCDSPCILGAVRQCECRAESCACPMSRDHWQAIGPWVCCYARPSRPWQVCTLRTSTLPAAWPDAQARSTGVLAPDPNP